MIGLHDGELRYEIGEGRGVDDFGCGASSGGIRIGSSVIGGGDGV